ncbi:hypothetical protein Pint_19837 [Pistacia integerrima]|uniref:Uncharacterized protein n=1 Tax=Pistacia integerrima TaxID=434235 RepID=A0ACC0XA50_9ROSI|nr:hypothetical protein Pint_19837 [Pistacia integerrima]
MDYGRLIFAIIGFSSSFFLCLPSLKRWHRHQISQENLRLVTEALDQAEEMMVKFQERHDRILNQICSYYMVNEELLKTLAGARDAMDGALAFAVSLRNMQMKILDSLSSETDASMSDYSHL